MASPSYGIDVVALALAVVLAAAVLFLVRVAPYVTGQIIAVDGGRSVGW